MSNTGQEPTVTGQQTPLQSWTESMHKKLKIISEQSEAIVDKIRGPQIEKSDQWQTAMPPGLLWTIESFNIQAERIIDKLSLVLETL